MKNKHEERIAMRVIEFNNALMEMPGGDKISLSDALFLFARLSVKREAEQWKEGFAFGYDAGQEYAEPDTEKQLIDIGLIPPQTQTT